MSKTFTSNTVATNDISTTNLATVFYSSTTPIGTTLDNFPLNSISRACQGGYGTTSTSRVGIIEIPNVESTLKHTHISSISLTFTCSKAGSTTASRKLTLHKSNIQGIKTENYPADYVGATIGTFTGNFYNGNVTLSFSSSSNSAAFEILKEYFESGKSTLVIYNGETSSGTSGSYSTNYLVVTNVTATIEYENEDYVYYNDSGFLKKCAVYYNNSGTAYKCSVYYNNGGITTKI